MTPFVRFDSAIGLHEATREEIFTFRRALRILEHHLVMTAPVFTSAGCVRDYLRLRMGSLDVEVFGMFWLNVQHRVLAEEDLFRGSVRATRVFPGEIARRGLQINAAVGVAYHNHVCDAAEPSRTDQELTGALRAALHLVGIHLLDHLVVGRRCVTSLRERGLM